LPASASRDTPFSSPSEFLSAFIFSHRTPFGKFCIWALKYLSSDAADATSPLVSSSLKVRPGLTLAAPMLWPIPSADSLSTTIRQSKESRIASDSCPVYVWFATRSVRLTF
jgi:hypothetical protein